MSSATKENPDTLCFLAYGHTSSGKTHSIAGNEKEAGILTLCVEELLRREGLVEVTMLEVYMDSVYDLLSNGDARRIRRRSTGGGSMAILVENLTTCTLSTVEQWKSVSSYGMKSRRTAATERNARSSRSHAIFTLKSPGVRLCLVDLAGSERQTVFSPQLNKESISINKSLSRLSTVLEALSVQQVKEDGSRSYVNFRDTTLTVLLQRYLNGASSTTFLSCIHPSLSFYQETLSTLRYTQRLRKIKTSFVKPDANEMSLMKVTEHQELLDELARLRQFVEENKMTAADKAVAQEKRILELEKSLEKQKSVNQAAGSVAPASHHHPQRVKDTRRIAGWLLSRVLGQLPQINVGYDDYFDRFFPSSIQVIGYVSTMAHLAPREDGDVKLAFLDVGDLAIGLSMVDAGIPSFVRLHRITCRDVDSWEAHEFDEAGHLVYVFAFFEVDQSVMEQMNEGDDEGESLECCRGYMSSEPLLPIATVVCVPESLPDEVKERVLQRLVTLQGEQDEALDQQNRSCDRSLSEENNVALDQLVDDSLVGEEEKDAMTSSSSSLSREVARQALDTSHIVTPYRDDSDSDSSKVGREVSDTGVARNLDINPEESSDGDERVEPIVEEAPPAVKNAAVTPERKAGGVVDDSCEDGTGVVQEPKITIVKPTPATPQPPPTHGAKTPGKALPPPDINKAKKNSKKDDKLVKHSGCSGCSLL
ncbi:kinesin [Angomonas deanei]|uniref:Kinesin motor domain containing protein, putative n=1 Tax=Angomonas deanei TaxID=59799 RepID=A0A7G2CVB8_9TRYP|nr:kinesin [Angomonas deanei]CAD2222363.1 Kinesin motor domain containing protein, putative [Angomonas deanei]|eukprot:EPY20140.1 kinesin [Angomonas deanei]